jgi:adenylate cyclase
MAQLYIHYLYENNEKILETASNSLLIGRDLSNEADSLDLLPDRTVSHNHAQLTRIKDKCWIENLPTGRAGTFVNGKKIAGRVEVNPGDVIRIGETTLKIEIVSGGKPTGENGFDGTITDTTPAGRPGDDVSITSDPASFRRHVKAFYAIGEALATAHTIEHLVNEVLRHILSAIPSAQNTGLFMPDANIGFALVAYQPDYQNAMFSTTLRDRAVERGEGFIWKSSDAEDMELSIQQHRIENAMYVPLIAGEELHGVLFVNNTLATHVFSRDDLLLMAGIANQAALFIHLQQLQDARRREEVILSNLLRHFSPSVANRIMQNPELRTGGEVVEAATVLVSDVRGFTRISREMRPDAVMQMLNLMFNAVTPLIFKYKGTVDKYIGDAVMAIFGSPEADERQCLHAVQAALAMQQAMIEIAETMQERFGVVLEIGVAIHTGGLMHGYLGADERLEFTVIGDTVNKAARLCDLAERGQIVISTDVYEQVKHLVRVYDEPVDKLSKHAIEGVYTAFVVLPDQTPDSIEPRRDATLIRTRDGLKPSDQ